MRITRKEMEYYCEQVCKRLQDVKSYNYDAPTEVWKEVWIALGVWQRAKRQQNRQSNRGLSNKLAWNVCFVLDTYNSGGTGIVKHEFWENLWSVYDIWINGIDYDKARKRYFVFRDIEQKRMDREFKERIS